MHRDDDHFALDHELEELEKEMSIRFEDTGSTVLRAEFKDELRRQLQQRIGEQAFTEQASSTNDNFQDGSQNRRVQTHETPDRPALTDRLKSFFQGGKGGFRGWKAVVSVVLVVALITTLFWGIGGENKPAQAAEVTIKALNADPLGVDPESAFLLTSNEPLTEEAVQEALNMEPAFPYTLAKQDGGREYKIIPEDKLDPNKIYVLSFNGDGLNQESQSWAFQTKAQFRVIRSLPGDQSSHVPVNTGIEIMFSHDNYDVNKVKEFFSIEPAVEGTFEKHKKTLVFVPKGLKPGTIYTVTLKKGLVLEGSAESLTEDYVVRFETVMEQAASAFEFNMDTNLTEFSTADTPAFPIYFWNYDRNAELPAVQIDLYRYPDHKEFQQALARRDQFPRWTYYGWNAYKEDLNPQYKVSRYDTKFLNVDRYAHYIALPQELAPGFYAAEIKAAEVVRQVWFQVSDLAVYLAQGDNSTLLWSHDLTTKAPAAGTEVLIASKNIAVKTDSSGAVLINDKLMGDQCDYALLKNGDKQTLVPLEAWPGWNARQNPNPMDFWKYLYVDRELYKPGDSINFWGVLAPRDKGKAYNGAISLELWGGDGPYYEGAEPSPVLTQTVTVSNNTFTGQMKLPMLKPGYYYVQLKAGDTILLSRGLSVETYQKPSYKLTLTQDKKAVFAGEAVNFQVGATFFEGTPVPNLNLNYHIEGKKGSAVTNSKGEAAIAVTGDTSGLHYDSYNYVTLGVNATLPEYGEIYSLGEFYVFKSKVYLTANAQRQKDSFTLNAKLAQVDLTAVNNGQYLAEEHYLKGPVQGSTVTGGLYREIWTKVESGKRYDFISKQVVPLYDYTYSVEHVNDFEMTTDANGSVQYTGSIDPGSSYYIDLKATDHEGREFTRRTYIGGDRAYSPSYQYYFLKAGANGYQPGEQAQVTMMVNDKELSPAGGNVLYFRGQRQIDHYEVSAKADHSFTFNAEHIPNINVYGVYFDGRNYQEASMVSISFASESKALSVSVQTDRAEYRPGGKVKLEVSVTDTAGKPVPDAQVNLNLVDEALFSLRDQNVNFLASLYGDHQYMFMITRKSHYHPEFGGGAEQGGEGPSDRKDFRDTVLFTNVRTNSHGQAEVEFQLPDNLTTWRVTYHAFTNDMQAGSGTAPIPVRLPFFVEMTAGDVFLAGDSPVVITRAFGSSLTDSQPIAYKMKLVTPGGEEKTWTQNGTAFMPADWKLPVLEAGKYTLTISATSNGMQDTVTKEFTAAKTFQARAITEHQLLSESTRIQGSDTEPTGLVFSDYEKSQYLRGLYQLAWSNGSRLEQKIAAQEARQLLAQYFPDEQKYFDGIQEESLLHYQRPDGGIGILPYAESELALSALVAVGTTGIFDEKSLAGYFYRVLEGDNAEDDKSLALLGLAALKEPVLIQINDYLKTGQLEPAVKVNLAAALLAIGDGAYAQTVYKELMQLYGQDLGASLRINAGSDQDDMITATTQMAVLAARLNQPEKNKLYQYLLDNPGKDILNTMEQLQILKYSLHYMTASPVSFTYELNGQKVVKRLNNTDVFKLYLQPHELGSIKFSQIEGKVGLIAEYTRPVAAGENGDARDLTVSRAYYVNDKKTTTLNRADLVKVVITYQIGDKAPDGMYEVVDVLPAGLAHISKPYNDYDQVKAIWDYPAEVNGQRLVFHSGKGRTDPIQITYYARVKTPGEYTGEAPVLSNISDNAIYTGGNADKIIIK